MYFFPIFPALRGIPCFVYVPAQAHEGADEDLLGLESFFRERGDRIGQIVAVKLDQVAEITLRRPLNIADEIYASALHEADQGIIQPGQVHKADSQDKGNKNQADDYKRQRL
jgi:hypothetical protein